MAAKTATGHRPGIKLSRTQVSSVAITSPADAGDTAPNSIFRSHDSEVAGSNRAGYWTVPATPAKERDRGPPVALPEPVEGVIGCVLQVGVAPLDAVEDFDGARHTVRARSGRAIRCDMFQSMKLLCWNVAGRAGDRLKAQVEAVLAVQPDILALQEVTRATHDEWLARLGGEGFGVLSTMELLAAPYPGSIRRKYCNILAAPHPITSLRGLSFPTQHQGLAAFPEKFIAGRVTLDGMSIDVHNAHLPPGATRGVIKPQAFEAIRRRVDELTKRRQILCGDFNTPRAENDDGFVTWADRRRGARQAAMWDAAERSILEHPRLRDAYRLLRAPGEPFAMSHLTRSGPKRYDHVYVSPGLRPTNCIYRTDWLEAQLSDHAAIEVELALA